MNTLSILRKGAKNTDVLMQELWKRFGSTGFFIKRILIPLSLLAVYSAAYAFLSSQLLTEGVSYAFTNRLWKYVVLVMGVLTLGFILLRLIKKPGDSTLNLTPERLSAQDFLLLLLPLTPVAQYVIHNQDILSPLESLSVLAFFVVFSGLLILAVPALLGFVSSPRTLSIVGLAFVFTLTTMASLSASFSWFEYGSLKVQMPVFCGVFLLAWVLFTSNNKKLLYLLVTVNFIANSAVHLVSQSGVVGAQPLFDAENSLISVVAQRKPLTTPNIYLLVYDAYVPDETMQAYGIDNRPQQDFLANNGFTIYPHVYSIGSSTVETMSRVLNVSTEYYGETRRGVSGDGVVHNLLQHLGYETYGIFPYDFMFRGVGSSYDFSIPEVTETSQDIHLISAILMGEFRFDIGFDTQPYDQFVETKQNILNDVSANQVFVYSHTVYPGHSQNSGVCLPNETALYAERLARANVEMRQDVAKVMENDPEAIIIVAGDHGPYLTKNCGLTANLYDVSAITRLDIQDRFATFLAIRWPTGDFVKYDDITVLQDLFPAVFAYLYSDPEILESKIEPIIIESYESISGASVNNGIIDGGANDGEPLFLTQQR
jgi:hypothetical protein